MRARKPGTPQTCSPRVDFHLSDLERAVMSTVTQPDPKVRFTVREFEQILDAGVFEDRHVELLDGEIFEVTKNPPHDFTVLALARKLEKLLPEADWTVREEKVIQLGPFWRPEPDIAVARGSNLDYQKRRPSPIDLPLLIEVTETTQDVDRGRKYRGYAAARIPVYWIVDLVNRAVEVHTQPTGPGDEAHYDAVEILDQTRELTVVLDGRDYGRIAVRDILPGP